MGVGGGWEAEGGLNHSLAVRKSRCVFSKAQKQPQCTCQDKMVVGSGLTPHTALLVHPSGTIHPQWTVMNLHGQINAACESRPGHLQTWSSSALSLVCLDSAIVWISC